MPNPKRALSIKREWTSEEREQYERDSRGSGTLTPYSHKAIYFERGKHTKRMPSLDELDKWGWRD